jgi:diguanylate cyclase (GGDEF)-like protein
MPPPSIERMRMPTFHRKRLPADREGVTVLAPSMAAIWERHLPDTRDRLELLEAAAADLAAGALAPERAAEARDAAHRLAGTVGTFGFAAASDAARRIELLLRAGSAPEDGGELSDLVAQMRVDLDLPAAPPIPDFRAPETRSLPLVLLLAPPTGTSERLRLEARRRGMRVVAAVHPDEARTVIDRDQPDVVLLDAAVEGATGFLAELRDDLPAVVLVDGDSAHARIEAARRGAAACLDAQAPPVRVVDQLAVALQRLVTEQERVLAVGHCRSAVSELTAAGLAVEALEDPSALWGALDRVDPALLVLDGDMAGVEELCAALRADPVWAVRPVVAALGGDDPERVDRLLAAGADDAVVGDGLVQRVRVRVARHRAYAATTGADALTGLADRRTSTVALRNLARMAERLAKPLCLTLIEADGSELGMRRLAGVLRRSFRSEDVVARWGARHVVVGMFGMDREGGLARVHEILSTFRDEPPHRTFCAGVAEYPRDGADLEAVCSAADEALTRARATAPDAVVGAGQTQASESAAQFVDVVIVEDEDAASEAVLEALVARGHRCWRFSNGAGAVAMLAGPQPKLRARVILLDLNLPAVDGVELLTLLATDGVLRASRVIIVSVNDDPAVIERTRALGAAEYMVKPVDLGRLADMVDAALGRRG